MDPVAASALIRHVIAEDVQVGLEAAPVPLYGALRWMDPVLAVFPILRRQTTVSLMQWKREKLYLCLAGCSAMALV